MTPNEVTSSNSSAFARLFWMGVGPAILAVLAVIIVNQASGWFTLSNLAFLAVLAGMIFARWRESRRRPENEHGRSRIAR